MENVLEQFRLDSLAAIKASGGNWQFDWEKLRYQYLDRMALIEDDTREMVYNELCIIQSGLVDVSEESEDTALRRFRAVSNIILLCNKDSQDPLIGLTKVADQYLQAYRISKTGGNPALSLSEIDERKVVSFYDKLIKVHQEVYRTHLESRGN